MKVKSIQVDIIMKKFKLYLRYAKKETDLLVMITLFFKRFSQIPTCSQVTIYLFLE
jgi:hypothetical protein